VTTVGFFGLPGCGKITVFHALTRQALTPQFLGYDLKPHQAVVEIPDPRLDRLEQLFAARNKVYASMEFVDIPGFDPASTETKLKNAVLEHYRKCDALALVVDLFSGGSADQAVAGARALLEELILLGLVTIERAMPRLAKAAQNKADKESGQRHALLARVQQALESGVPVRRLEFDPAEDRLLREYAFISAKPVLLVLNVADTDFTRPAAEVPGLAELEQLAADEGLECIKVCAALEAELADMEPAEAAEYMAEFGVTEASLPRFIRAAFQLLGLETFFTGSEKEVRSWPLRIGSNAQEAAGVIHTDMYRGFIRAETVAFDDLIEAGSMAAAKAAGKLRLEGKDYLVRDGDLLTIRFNV
jgi:GTP-binding protein YchF